MSTPKKQSTLKRVLTYVSKYPLSLIGSILFSLITVACTLVVPVLLGDAIDCIVGKGEVDFDTLKDVFIKVAAFTAGAAVSQWLMGVCNNRLSCNVVRDIRADAFKKIVRLPISYIDSHSHGDTVARVVADADQFSDGLLIGFSQFFTGLTTILGTIAFMLITNWIIGLVVVVVTPLSLFVARFVATHTHKYFKSQTEVRGEQTAFSEEMISGLKTVQAFSQEDENLEKFDEINGRLEKAAMNATFYSSLTNPSTRFINNVVYAIVALVGGLFVISGNGFTVGGLTKFLAYANQYTKPFNEISGVITELKSAFTCAARVFELIDEQAEVSDEDNIRLENPNGEVSLDDVSFSYTKERKLIEHLTLDVRRGQRVAIVGRTGSGKTTLINLLMRFYDTDGGAVKVDGKDVKRLTRKSLRKNFGMVLQETWLKSGTVRENIKLGNPSATDEEMIAAAKASHAHGFIRRLEKGYDTLLSEDGGSLSEGQKQLLCIARIMLLLPPMLILDEATSSIDTRTELKISDAFTKLMDGRTSFIVAHRLSTIVHADVILVMEKGKVVEQGTHLELLEKKGAYYQLYSSQFA
ncbi:MAG: ABC transporter ATP-binding protein [Clostridia bacterium]|nr:ABC transporter ATP-binding protein [Clostridia bacterium]